MGKSPHVIRTGLLLAISVTAPVDSWAQQAPSARTPVAPQPQRAARKGPVPARTLTPAEQHAQAVEGRLVPAVRIKGKPVGDMTLVARMKKYHVPGVSIAVINDNAIEWAKGYGTADASPVDTATVFRAGAAGEPVAAIIALRLSRAKKLDLARDVNRSLKGWKIPKSDFTRNKPVTARALLTHSSGLAVTAPGASLTGITSVASPGDAVHPSPADYQVLEQLFADLAKRPFASLAADSVLVPLEMHHSGFSAAGLSTTPSDLARLTAEIQRAGGGKDGKVLIAESARQMLSAEHVGWPGMGVMVEGRDQSARFRASGSLDGSSAELVGYISRGQGAVVMTNSSGGDALAEEILNAIATVYGWPDFVSPEKSVARVDSRVYDRFVGRYAYDSREVSIARRGTRLFIGPSGKESTELLPESVSDYFSTDPGAFYSFVFDEHGKVQAFTERQRFDYTRWDRR